MGCSLSSSNANDAVRSPNIRMPPQTPSDLNLTQHDKGTKNVQYVRIPTRGNMDLTQHSVHQDVPKILVDVKDDLEPIEIEFESDFIKDVAVMSKKGITASNPMRKNQDSYVRITDTATNTLILAVLDGHGEFGELAANFMAKEIEKELILNKHFQTDLKKAITDVLAVAESFLLHRHRGQCGFSGTTLSLAALRGSNLLVANIGDSRVILGGSDNSSSVSISRDHKPSDPDEKARIEAAGGRVIVKTYEDGYVGPARVYLGDADLPGLAMSRSIADTIVHTIGVSSTPEFFERKLTPQDKYIVLATDGLWDFVSTQDAIALIRDKPNAKAAVEYLQEQSNLRWQQNSPQVIDDTTIGVIFL